MGVQALDVTRSQCRIRHESTRVHRWTLPHSPCAVVSGRLAQETPEPRFFFSRDVLTLFCRLWGFSWNRPAPQCPTESGTLVGLWPHLVSKEDGPGSTQDQRLEGVDISGLKEAQQNQGTHQIFIMSPSGGGHTATSPCALCVWLSQFYWVRVRLDNGCLVVALQVKGLSN